MLEITPLTESHLEDAALLVSQRYQRLCAQVPHLPDRYAEVEELLPLLQNILKKTGSGVAAIRNNRLAGFLTAWQMPSFRGQRSIYSPEWANGADLEDSAYIYEEMYSRIASTWVADKFVAHYISLFPNDVDALQAWNWLGFGMFAVDAVRGLDPVRSDAVDIFCKRAEPGDIDLVIGLQVALFDYIKAAPNFLISKKFERTYYEEWLGNPDKPVWLAYVKDEPVAFMRFGPADDDVCMIIVDEKTTSIYAAYTKEEARSGGVATALLAHALESAREKGYERCAVSFEPTNLLGRRFWLRHFQAVCYSFLRVLDDRLTEG